MISGIICLHYELFESELWLQLVLPATSVPTSANVLCGNYQSRSCWDRGELHLGLLSECRKGRALGCVQSVALTVWGDKQVMEAKYKRWCFVARGGHICVKSKNIVELVYMNGSDGTMRGYLCFGRRVPLSYVVKYLEVFGATKVYPVCLKEATVRKWIACGGGDDLMFVLDSKDYIRLSGFTDLEV